MDRRLLTPAPLSSAPHTAAGTARGPTPSPLLRPGDKVVLTAFGTHGDVAPFVQIGRHLRAFGMNVVVATSDYYRPLVESRGLTFVHGAPSESQLKADLGMDVPAMMQAATHKLNGPRFAARKVVMPYLEQSHAQLLAACQDAKVLLSHVYSFAAPLVAEQLPSLEWRSVCLQPMALMLAADAPVLSEFLPVHRLAPLLGVKHYGWLMDQLKGATRSWTYDIHLLRHKLGLSKTSANPLFEGGCSEQGTYGLFDPVLMPSKDGLPRNWHWAGFCHDDGTVAAPDPGLQQFLAAGPAPVVFTLGSSAVHYSPHFYEEAAKACQALGVRGVLLTGGHRCRVKSTSLFEAPWASHAWLFPKACAVVHQGGMGTLSQALRAGVPQVVVPFGNDQPDNAHRLHRLGVSATVRTWQVHAPRLAAALGSILANRQVQSRASELAHEIARPCGGLAVAQHLIAEG